MFNLASKARPYFGAVVLTCCPAHRRRHLQRHAHAQRRLPGSHLSAHRRRRQSAGLDVTKMEVKVTRPLEEAVSTVLGVAQVRSKTIRGGSEMSIDFAPGTDMQPGRAARPGTASAPPRRDAARRGADRRADDAVGLPDHVGGADRRRQPGPAARLRLLPAGPADQEHPGRALRQRGRRRRPRDRGRSPGRTTCWPPACPPPTSPTRSASSDRLQPVGRIEGQPLAFQILVNTQAETVRQIEELVISTRKDQPLRVRDVADVKVLHQDRVAVGRLRRQGRGGDHRLPPAGRQHGQHLPRRAALLDAQLTSRPAVDKRPPRNIQATVVYDQARVRRDGRATTSATRS